MSLYENAYKSTYEEILTYYPLWYSDVLEMTAVWKTLCSELDEARNGIVQAINNCFVNSADEAAISRYEKFLGVTYDGERTLSERRDMVASFFIGKGHIGEPEIVDIMSKFTSGSISVNFENGIITVKVEREFSDKFNLSDSTYVLLKRIPTHLRLKFLDLSLPMVFHTEENFILIDILYAVVFQNCVIGEEKRLDGSSLLDGTWVLSAPLKGILMADIEFFNRIKENTGSVSGTLTKDNPFKLDGTYFLNAEKSLSGGMDKEEI